MILAAITLSTLAGRRGIINQAQNAEKEHTQATALEDITLVTYQSLDNKGNTDTTKLEQGLNDIGATIKSKTENKWTVEQNGYEFEINIETGDVIAKEAIEELTLAQMYKKAEEAGCDGTNCEETDHLHIGDWVDYKPDTKTSGYDLLAEKSGEDTNQNIPQEDLYWRVWGYDENTDEVILISNTPTHERVYFYGFKGYNNIEKELNTMCEELYSKSGIGTARSMNIEDINKVSSYTEEQKIEDFGDSTQEGGIGYTQTFTNCYYPDESSSTGYSIGTQTFTDNAYYYTLSDYINNSKQLELLIGTEGEFDFWLASRFVEVDERHALFRGAFVNFNRVEPNWNEFGDSYYGEEKLSPWSYLRPIIYLQSKVTEEEVPIIEPQPDEWDGDPHRQPE